MKVYYLNRERFEKGDTVKAAEYAIQCAKEDSNIDTITFLVYQQDHYSAFLGEMNFTRENTNGMGIQCRLEGKYRFILSRRIIPNTCLPVMGKRRFWSQ